MALNFNTIRNMLTARCDLEGDSAATVLEVMCREHLHATDEEIAEIRRWINTRALELPGCRRSSLLYYEAEGSITAAFCFAIATTIHAQTNAQEDDQREAA